jgi:hypothetical protein
MSYVQYGLIEATDFNTLAGGNPSTTSGKINTVWATGTGDAGYGQTAISNVSSGGSVLASDWAGLVNTTANSAAHQGTSITSVTAPSSGGVITFNSAIASNLTTIYNNRLNAAAQGTTTVNNLTWSSAWSSSLTFTHTVTFTSGDAARYFFNAGGQIQITCSHSDASVGINELFNNLASDIGSIVLSAPSSGSITIASGSYTGITKVGSDGNTPTISTNSGYYALTSSNVTVFTQTADSGPGSYLNSFIRVIVKSNGTQGSNGDKGNIITIYTVWDEIPNGLTVASGSTTSLTVKRPSSVYIANTWGTINIFGSVSGS